MKTMPGVQLNSPDFASAGVQARIDAVVAHFTNTPRGFARAWCESLSPKVLASEPWDLDRISTFNVPKDVARLAQADAELIAGELANGGPAALAFELEAACVVGGLDPHAYLPANHRAETRPFEGRDAVTYYQTLDKGADAWQRALGRSGEVSELVLRDLGRHHARLTDASPLAFDNKGIAAITGSRVAMQTDAALRVATKEAYRLSPDDTAAIIHAFTNGKRHTVSGLTEANLKDIMTSLARLIGTDRAGDTNRFLQHFREGAHHGGVEFVTRDLAISFARDEFAAPLRAACERHGLDYLDYNGIFDIERFSAKVEAARAKPTAETA